MPWRDRADHPVLVHVVHGEEQVVHRADGVGRGVDRDLDRVGQVVADEVADVAVERRREQHRLVRPVHWRRIHSTCGVKPSSAMRSASSRHDDLDRAEIDLVRLQQVDQPQRRGDDHLDAAVRAPRSAVPAGAAVDGQHDAHAGVAATGSSTSATCRASSRVGTSTRPSGLRGLGLVGDAGQHRHAEGERLAGAGLGPTAHVATLQRDRDRLGLDRERLGEPGGGETQCRSARHAEVGEAGRAPRPPAGSRWWSGCRYGSVRRRLLAGAVRGFGDARPAGRSVAGWAAALWDRSWSAQDIGQVALPQRTSLPVAALQSLAAASIASLGSLSMTRTRAAPSYVGRAPHIRVRPPPASGRGLLAFSGRFVTFAVDPNRTRSSHASRQRHPEEDAIREVPGLRADRAPGPHVAQRRDRRRRRCGARSICATATRR